MHTIGSIFIPLCSVVLLVLFIYMKSSILSVIHIVEYCQELFLLMLMNVVRDTCLYEFKLSFQYFFFAFAKRPSSLIHTNYLQRVFFQSVYFLENTAEISFIITGLLFIYLIFAALHLMMYKNEGGESSGKTFSTMLNLFEFGFFFRML